ncbi:MAG: helix-turn-helix domain-containing protein [Propionicimonas sp.]|uniref:TetR/AcrR family transcriptional regulator n=1 Tax=Propionicimonas sp. TaxID=1955623 RepID=UPI002B208C59|nr:helix-turn-helix domain-containing protein [Propionicimonas sp.]MEA4944516.1 helix-turn-helix domain-containing protein [Propionicimonas sp.]
MTETAPVPLRERLRDQTHNEIAAAALDLFDQQGFRATTMEDIARKVGVSTRTVFRHFPTKSDLVFDWLPGLEQLLNSLPLTATTPSDLLDEIERTILQALDDYDRVTAPAAAGTYRRFRQLVQQDPDLRQTLDAWESRLVQLAETRLGEQLPAGIGELPIAVVLHLIIATVTAALDAWAFTTTNSLRDLYQQARALRGQLLVPPPPTKVAPE